MALADEIVADLKAKKAGGGPPAKGSPPMPADNADEEGGEGYAADEEAIAGDMMDAMEARDPAAMASAMKAFIDVCRPLKG